MCTRCGSSNSGMTQRPPFHSVPLLRLNMAAAEEHILMINGFARSHGLHVEPRLIFETNVRMTKHKRSGLDAGSGSSSTLISTVRRDLRNSNVGDDYVNKVWMHQACVLIAVVAQLSLTVLNVRAVANITYVRALRGQIRDSTDCRGIGEDLGIEHENHVWTSELDIRH